MVVVMQEGATEEQIQSVISNLMEMGFDIHRSTGVAQTVLGAVGANPDFDHRGIELLEGVQEVHRISSPYKLASRHFRPEGSLVQLGQGVAVGGGQVVVMAGPCSVESAAQIDTIAAHVAEAGARVLRGGAFKPRSSPYSFQGMGQEGLELMRSAADKYKLLVVSEVMDHIQIPMMLDYGRVSGGRPKHAEFQFAAGAWQGNETNPAETGHCSHDRGIAALGRVHHVRREL
jgi:3-deoxy-7-phosphoheptulonate synthase